MEAFREMGRQALMPQNQRAIKEVLLGPARLYQGLIEAHRALRGG